MANELQIFNFENFKVRSISKNGEPWFVLKDVCDVLGISNPSMVLDRLVEDERQKIDPKQYLGSFSNTPITVINESGLYSVVVLSRKPEAERFRRWITRDVVPSIRKNGVYATDDFLADPRKWAAALTALAEEREAKAQLEAENKTLQLTADKYEAQTNTVGLYRVGDIAEELGITAKKLNQFLHEAHIQYKPNGSNTWQLYAEHLEHNYALARIVRLDNGYEKPMLLWTPRGRDFIFDLVEEKQPEWYA